MPTKNGNNAGRQLKHSEPTGASTAGSKSGPGASGAAKAELKQLRKAVKQLQAKRSDGSNVAHRVLYEQFKGALAAQIDPFNADPVRFSENTGRPTAVNKLFRVDSAGSASVSTNGTVLAPNCGFAAIYRDPRLASVRYEVRSSATRSYSAVFATSGTLQTSGRGPTSGEYFRPVEFRWNASGGGTWQAHGPRMAMLQDIEGVDRVWVDVEPAGASTTIFYFGGLPPSSTVDIIVERELRGIVTQTAVALATNPGGFANWTVPVGQSGRYAIFSGTNLGGQTAVTWTITTSCPHAFCHRMLPELENQIADIDGMRINSASILYSDRSAELYSQGSIVTCQISGDEDWAEHAGLEQTVGGSVNNYSVVAAYNIAKKGKYKAGRYNFLKLSGIKDLDMLDICEGDGSSKYFAPVPYMQMKDYIVVLYDAGNAASLTGEWTMCWHTEIETESQWREVKVPSLHPDVFTDVQFTVGQASQDYENPKHLKAIWNFVKKAAGVLSTVGGAVGPALPPQFAVPTMIGAAGLGAISNL